MINVKIHRFTGADGVEHVVTYIADDKGYRVVGDAKIEPQQKPTTARPTQPPTQAPTRPPTQPPTRPPTQAPVVKAPAAAVQVVPVSIVQAVPAKQAVQYVQAVPAQFGGFYHSGFYGACGGAGQEVIGSDGARYILTKI